MVTAELAQTRSQGLHPGIPHAWNQALVPSFVNFSGNKPKAEKPGPVPAQYINIEGVGFTDCILQWSHKKILFKTDLKCTSPNQQYVLLSKLLCTVIAISSF